MCGARPLDSAPFADVLLAAMAQTERNLLKLGDPVDLAVTRGASNKSYWRSST